VNDTADRPQGPLGAGGLVLFHGAGGDRDHRLFLRLESELGIPVARCNFAYRQKGPGRRPPDRMPKLIQTIRERAAELAEGWGVSPFSLVFGGRSMGGRAASMAIAEGLPAAGLVLMSYPLHPPGKPEALRVEHLPDVTVPGLLVQGTRDPFGTPGEFATSLTQTYGGPLRELWLEGAGHDPKPAFDDAVVAAVADWIG
jgi:predicted alpha/beta-hydrolase family hydrolase